MTLTTEGANIEGLLRALQGDLMVFTGFSLLALGVFALVRRAIGASLSQAGITNAQAAKARYTSSRALLLTLAIAIAALGWRVATVAAINRMPRADTNGSAVYDQMKSLAGPQTKP